MTTSFKPAAAQTHSLLRSVRDRHHADLGPVALGVVMADRPESAPIVAVRILSAHLRSAGSPDVILTLHADRWENTTPEGREAVLGHAMAHLAIARVGDKVKLDAARRPRIKRRPYSIPGVGFVEIHKRYGARSVEHAALLAIKDATAHEPDPAPRFRPKPATRRENPAFRPTA